MRWRDSDDEQQLNFWPAVADVFIGLLALLLLASLAAYLEAFNNRGKTPPPAKQDFKEKFEEAFAHTMSDGGVEVTEQPRIEDRGFSELHIYFPDKFLFRPCEVRLKESGGRELQSLKILLNEFNDHIQRVEITGHTDRDPPRWDPRCREQGIRSNWQLSARRAITVVEELVPPEVPPTQGDGAQADQGLGSTLDPVKVWAAALGQYHPVVPHEETRADKARNRRIEILVRFKEQQ